MAYVSTIVSGAACLGVLIGLVTGIFFLLLTAMKWVSRVRSTLQEEELTRQKRFLVSSSGLPETRKTENGFGSTLREGTSEGFQSDAEKTENHSTDQKQAEVSSPMGSRTAKEKYDPNLVSGPSSDTVEVREKMEKMVETMIGGPLDGTTVGQLSTHSAYKNDESTDMTGSNLKRLIKQIVDEAMCLPDIKEVPCPPKVPKDPPDESFDSKSYEDILATAILNKVIEGFQNNSRKQSEPDVGNPKPRLRHRRLRKNNGSDELRSDGDWSDTSRSDQLSLTIEEYIEEVTTAVEVSEEDASELSDFETSGSRRIPFPESGRTVVDAGTDDENSDVEEQSTATELVTSTSSWEENWLFQKKRLRSTPNAHHPVPVPMLVPNPSEDFRALVGGVDADDLSDMSECSDSLLQDFITTEEKPPEPGTPPHSGDEKKSETVKIILTHITEESFYDKLGVSRDGIKNDSADVTVEAPEQKPPDPPADGPAGEDSFQEDASTTEDHFSSAGPLLVPSSTDSEDSLIRCRVAEREKEKWMNPVPLPDNPYSLENIEKRERQRRRNEYFRIGTFTGESIDFPDDPVSSDEPSKKNTDRRHPPFARDYYVNASKHPSGRSSPSSDQVSRHSHQPFSSWGRTPRSKLSRLHPDIADGSAQYFTPHIRPLQTITSQHFSQVFKTSQQPPKPRKYRYGSHTLKLRPKTKETIHKKPLQQQLSDFERKSLREDLTHSLLRARDATPNFILNPVFNPDLSESSFHALPYDVNRQFGPESNPPDPPAVTSPPCAPIPPHTPTTQESGYGSDSLDHSSDSLEFWRLTPPKTPEVIQTSFVSIADSRKSEQKPRNSVRKSLSSFY